MECKSHFEHSKETCAFAQMFNKYQDNGNTYHVIRIMTLSSTAEAGFACITFVHGVALQATGVYASHAALAFQASQCLFSLSLSSHLCVVLVNSKLLQQGIQFMYRSQYPNTSLGLHRTTGLWATRPSKYEYSTEQEDLKQVSA